jgi:hypothetical protein
VLATAPGGASGVFDLDGGALLSAAPALPSSGRVARAPAGEGVAFVDGDVVRFWSPGDGAQQELPLGGARALALAWSADASRLALLVSEGEERAELRVVDARGATMFSEGVPGAARVAWAGDGELVLGGASVRRVRPVAGLPVVWERPSRATTADRCGSW